MRKKGEGDHEFCQTITNLGNQSWIFYVFCPIKNKKIINEFLPDLLPKTILWTTCNLIQDIIHGFVLWQIDKLILQNFAKIIHRKIVCLWKNLKGEIWHIFHYVAFFKFYFWLLQSYTISNFDNWYLLYYSLSNHLLSWKSFILNLSILNHIVY